MSRQELEEIWTTIKQEGKTFANCEPILASFFMQHYLNMTILVIRLAIY